MKNKKQNQRNWGATSLSPIAISGLGFLIPKKVLNKNKIFGYILENDYIRSCATHKINLNVGGEDIRVYEHLEDIYFLIQTYMHPSLELYMACTPPKELNSITKLRDIIQDHLPQKDQRKIGEDLSITTRTFFL